MKNIIVGTAGHVDHGKTTLIKAMTGIDTDRLKEEKERGMTIDLGFASLDLPGGLTVGIVDVPGHERFIKNMLAGAGGVDVALLVIAADESVMPQTVEHLEILELLEVRRGVVAITKADMVDADWIEYVKDDIRGALAGTFLAGSPMIPVASLSGEGVPELLAELEQACDSIEGKDTSGDFRLPVDRVFTMTGFGSVVTGTLLSGTVKIGDPVELMPKGLQSRVRQLRVHGKKMESAQAGMRVAMNLAGLEVTDIERGDVCATPGTMESSLLIDLRLSLLTSAPHPLRNRARVRLHIGTAELLGRVVLLDKDELKPGEQAYIQFRSEMPLAATRGDRFVIRSYSPMQTIGGGTIVNPSTRKHKRFDEATLEALETSSKGSPEELLEQTIKQAASGTSIAELSKNVPSADVHEMLQSLKESGRVIEIDGGRLFHASVLDKIASGIEGILEQFHAKYPLRQGMSREELRSTAVNALDSRSFAALLAHLERIEKVSVTETSVSLPGYRVSLTPQQESAAKNFSESLRKAGLNVPSSDQLIEETGLPPSIAKDVIDLLVSRQEIVKIAEDLYYHASTLAKAEEMLRGHLEEHGSITVSQFRDLTGSTRKYALPLLEYFDSQRLTRRMGDERVLVKPISS